jgi:hypothetical protein
MQIENEGELLLLVTGDRRVAARPEVWKPFGTGPDLGAIVASFNQRGAERILGATADLVRACACQVAPRLCAAAVTLGQIERLAPGQLQLVSILLLDLDTLALHPQALALLQDLLDEQRPVYHLLQVGRRPDVRSLHGYFQARARVLIPEEPVFTDLEALVAYLDCILVKHERAWQGVLSNPYDITCSGLYGEPYVHPRHSHFVEAEGAGAESFRRAYDGYHSRLAETVREVRDAAMARGLNDAQTVNLGRGWAVQTFLLSLVAEQVRRRPEELISVKPVGRSLFEMPTASPLKLECLRRTVLVVVHLNPPQRRPGAAQRAALSELGLAGGVTAVVHLDRPELWRKIYLLSAFISVDSFEAELPVWNGGEYPEEVGFTEAAFSVNIEESFSKRLDDYYERTGQETSNPNDSLMSSGRQHSGGSEQASSLVNKSRLTTTREETPS